MNNKCDQIVLQLYKQYYSAEGTPNNFVSSHWKHYHKKISIEIEDNEIKALSGAGFGDISSKIRVQTFFDWFTIISYLTYSKHKHNKKELLLLIKTAMRVARRMSFVFSYDFFRQVCSLHLLMSNLKMDKKMKILAIGDGYGFLSALIKQAYPGSSIFLVDLGKTLLFQAHYCGKAYPEYSHALVSVSNKEEKEKGIRDADFIYCPAELLERLNGISFDVAINVASMQEMNQETISGYFDFLRQNLQPENIFYCCNREMKEMPGGEVSRFLSYPWHEKDINLIDELCPWHQIFYSVHTLRNGPKFGKIRIPFINYFDGIHRHRLTILHTNKK